MPSFKVSYEVTPNPQSLKFVLNSKICNQTLEIDDRQKAQRSPLAEKILGFPWAKSVFLGSNFITVTKEDWLEWDMICDPLAHLIKEHLDQGGPALLPEKPIKKPKGAKKSVKESESEQKIKNILKKEIQPAVTMDGGFIEFVSYQKGIVYLKLKGACAGCPSSSLTLKQGIESRLKQAIPEIKEVAEI